MARIQISSKAFDLLPLPFSKTGYLAMAYAKFEAGKQDWGQGHSHVVESDSITTTQLEALAKYAKAQLRHTTNDDKTRLKIAIARLERAAEEMGS